MIEKVNPSHPDKLADDLPNVHFAGRLGEYKYYDMDDTIESAMLLSKKLWTLKKL